MLVREAFVRRFANGKALGSYAGLASSPYRAVGSTASRASERPAIGGSEQWWSSLRGYGRATSPAPLKSAGSRTSCINGRRVRKIMVVALARKLLIALWRFVIDGGCLKARS